MKHLGTTLTEEDFIKTYEILKSLPPNYQSVYGLSINDIELMKIRKEQYDKIKYLEMWKKVKREFPFVNKM
jgi:hypothetical protein